jgi:hypothetical protein
MTTTFDQAEPLGKGTPGILDRDRIIATTGFNRWLVPPAALCIHLCIGMAYGFSVFWLPLSRALGITASKTCPDMTIVEELFTTTCDWRVASMGWMYTLFFVVLGLSAAVWGGWLERVGPRKAGMRAHILAKRGEQMPNVVVIQGDDKETLRLFGEAHAVRLVRDALSTAAVNWSPLELGATS